MPTCKQWSMTDDRFNAGLCSMVLSSESRTKTKNCTICVIPGSCIAGCSYRWNGTVWEIVSRCCPGGTTAVPPESPGVTIGQIQAGTCE